MAKWNSWFKVSGIDMRWLPRSPANRMARCDRVFNHLVEPDEPRLQVDSDEGPIRKRGKGKRHEYLCQRCAFTAYELQVPSLMDESQQELF